LIKSEKKKKRKLTQFDGASQSEKLAKKFKRYYTEQPKKATI
jgi:hypothetical protein